MKKVLTILAFSLAVGAFAAIVTPRSLTLAWDYPEYDDATNKLTFKVYASDTLNPPNWQVAGTVEYPTKQITLQNVTPGKRFYYVTASNFWGESDPSNVAQTPAMPLSVNTLKLKLEP